jgi:hypothetical protein
VDGSKGDVRLVGIPLEQALIWTKNEINKVSDEINVNKVAGLDVSQLENKKQELIHCLKDLEQRIEKENGPNLLIPAYMAALNGIIAVGIGWYYLSVLDMFGVVFFELIVLTMCSSLFIGAGLIAIKRFKAGAIFCMIGGVLSAPLGIIGIFAANKALYYSKMDLNPVSSNKIA